MEPEGERSRRTDAMKNIHCRYDASLNVQFAQGQLAMLYAVNAVVGYIVDVKALRKSRRKALSSLLTSNAKCRRERVEGV
ncbi:hypothetical protein BDV19DRAFT_365101 [Aspergillus venezuelensis]